MNFPISSISSPCMLSYIFADCKNSGHSSHYIDLRTYINNTRDYWAQNTCLIFLLNVQSKHVSFRQIFCELHSRYKHEHMQQAKCLTLPSHRNQKWDRSTNFSETLHMLVINVIKMLWMVLCLLRQMWTNRRTQAHRCKLHCERVKNIARPRSRI